MGLGHDRVVCRHLHLIHRNVSGHLGSSPLPAFCHPFCFYLTNPRVAFWSSTINDFDSGSSSSSTGLHAVVNGRVVDLSKINTPESRRRFIDDTVDEYMRLQEANFAATVEARREAWELQRTLDANRTRPAQQVAGLELSDLEAQATRFRNA